MCFTGGYALAMMVDERSRRPWSPSPRRRSRSASGVPPISASPPQTRTRSSRAPRPAARVLGIRYVEDKAVGTRFETLHRLLGDRFLAVDLPGKGHATLTEHRSQEAVDRVLAFFGERLRA